MTTINERTPAKRNLSTPPVRPGVPSTALRASVEDAQIPEPPSRATPTAAAAALGADRAPASYASRAVTIHLTYHGVPVDLHRADLGIETIEQLVDQITARDGWAAAGDKSWPTLPDGTPICPRHGVPMRLRQRQGDEWWSHNVAGDGEEPCYCRGYPGKNSPGWDRR
jgi:hypothetical protein